MSKFGLCRDCNYWARFEGEERGQCCARAPIPNYHMETKERIGLPVWPKTHITEGCGDFIPKGGGSEWGMSIVIPKDSGDQ